MDELWQRHKSFIIACAVMFIAFLIGWAVKSSTYSDTEMLKRQNESLKKDLGSQLSNGKAPDRASIKEQTRLAGEAEENFRRLMGSVASVASPADRKIAYVRESCEWALANIGKSGDLDALANLYRQSPQSALFRLKEMCRAALVGRAAQTGKTVDTSLGIVSGFQDDEVPVALHGLAIVTELVTRALDSDVGKGIDAVLDIRITARSRRRSGSDDDDASKVVSFPVSMRVVGDPNAVSAFMRTFNEMRGKTVKRLMVLDAVEGVTRPRDEEITVSTRIRVLGLHHLDAAQ